MKSAAPVVNLLVVCSWLLLPSIADTTADEARNRSYAQNSTISAGCVLPIVASDLPALACVEGAHIAEGDNCTMKCGLGYVATVQSLMCNNGSFFPPQFACIDAWSCRALTGIPHSQSESCREGKFVTPGAVCTPMCVSGYNASEQVLHCFDGGFLPPSFRCDDSNRTTPAGNGTAEAGNSSSNSSGNSSEHALNETFDFGELIPVKFICAALLVISICLCVGYAAIRRRVRPSFSLDDRDFALTTDPTHRRPSDDDDVSVGGPLAALSRGEEDLYYSMPTTPRR